MNCHKEVVDAHRAGALTLAASSQDRLARTLRLFCHSEAADVAARNPYRAHRFWAQYGFLVRNDKAKKLVFFSYRAGKIHGREQDEDI